jgi:hypothetical protein
MNTKRAYFKCIDCLTAFAVENIDSKILIKCACGGRAELMGHVIQDRLVKTELRVPCDDRCTNAQGPSCNCQCGGEHHGTGRLVEVHTSMNGDLVAQVSKAESIERGKMWRALVDAAMKRVEVRFGDALVDYRANRRIPREVYFEIRNTLNSISKIKSMRVYKSRIEAIMRVAC